MTQPNPQPTDPRERLVSIVKDAFDWPGSHNDTPKRH
jgi:hypothetical protein